MIHSDHIFFHNGKTLGFVVNPMAILSLIFPKNFKGHNTSLRDRLVEFIEGLNLELNCELKGDTSLIQSSIIDSLGLFNLAEWIEREIGMQVDRTTFNLLEEWDTIADILNFINKKHGIN